jgi:hypothetical protein
VEGASSGSLHRDIGQQLGGQDGGQWITGPLLPPPSAVGIPTASSTVTAISASVRHIDVSVLVISLTSSPLTAVRLGEGPNGSDTAGTRLANARRLDRS